MICKIERADENDKSRRTAPSVFRRRHIWDKGETKGGCRNLGRRVAFQFAAGPALCRTYTHPLPELRYPSYFVRRSFHTAKDEPRIPISNAPGRPPDIWEIIQLLIANGYSMGQIRAMFPGLFPNDPVPNA
jgi:hypothetical protein